MEHLLAAKGVFRTRSIAATVGADEDRGQGLGRSGRTLIERSAQRTGVPLIFLSTFEEQIAARMKAYRETVGETPIKLYVNIGGGVGSLGARFNGLLLKPGLTMSTVGLRFKRKGVMTLMAKKKIPIVHINYIDRLAARYDYPVDPQADRTPGEGTIYASQVHNLGLAGALLAGLLIVFFVTIRLDTRSYIRRQKQEHEMVGPPLSRPGRLEPRRSRTGQTRDGWNCFWHRRIPHPPILI